MKILTGNRTCRLRQDLSAIFRAGRGTVFVLVPLSRYHDVKLKNSILSSNGIVQPIIVNRVGGRIICIEGNTRVAIYRSFMGDKVAGDWTKIPAMVYTDLPEDPSRRAARMLADF
jgi:hypothetical protein